MDIQTAFPLRGVPHFLRSVDMLILGGLQGDGARFSGNIVTKQWFDHQQRCFFTREGDDFIRENGEFIRENGHLIEHSGSIQLNWMKIIATSFRMLIRG